MAIAWFQVIVAFIAGGFLMPMLLAKLAGRKASA